MKQLYELHGEDQSIRGIAGGLRISRNSVRKYLRSPRVPRARPRPSKLDSYKVYIQGRLSDGLENCVVLLRELRAQGYTILFETKIRWLAFLAICIPKSFNS